MKIVQKTQSKKVLRRAGKLRLISSNFDLRPSGFRYHILESLILAQDERWRRA